jgi:hypothetical protein
MDSELVPPWALVRGAKRPIKQDIKRDRKNIPDIIVTYYICRELGTISLAQRVTKLDLPGVEALLGFFYEKDTSNSIVYRHLCGISHKRLCDFTLHPIVGYRFPCG